MDNITADKFIQILTSISVSSTTISSRFIAIKGDLAKLGVLESTKDLVKGATADIKSLGEGLLAKIPPKKKAGAKKVVDDINASWGKAAKAYS